MQTEVFPGSKRLRVASVFVKTLSHLSGLLNLQKMLFLGLFEAKFRKMVKLDQSEVWKTGNTRAGK